MEINGLQTTTQKQMQNPLAKHWLIAIIALTAVIVKIAKTVQTASIVWHAMIVLLVLTAQDALSAIKNPIKITWIKK